MNITNQKCLKINPIIFEPVKNGHHLYSRSITSLLYHLIDNIDKMTLYDIERLSTKVNYNVNYKIKSRKSYTIYSNKLNLIDKLDNKIQLIKTKFDLEMNRIILLEISMLYDIETSSVNYPQLL